MARARTASGSPATASTRLGTAPPSRPDSPADFTDTAFSDGALPVRRLDDALARARDGDEEGFRVLWRELNPPLLRYLRVRVRTDSAALDPEDVAAETWLQVVRDLQGFRGGGEDFRRWLFTVARHRAVDAARAALRQPPTTVLDPGEATLPVPSAEDDALAGLGLDAALALVATLPPDQAEVVALRVIAGLDVTAVAHLLGKSKGAVRVAAHRGLHTLARALAPGPQ